jgi:nitroreductase
MDFKNLVQQRRSHRKFTTEEIDSEDVKMILRAGLMSPTSKGQRAWQFVVVDDPIDLQKLADSKEQGAQLIARAAMAVVVLGDDSQNNCWIEDGSLAAFAMQLQAEDLGLGSCWVQIRDRHLSDGTPAEEVVRGILDIPKNHRVLCIVAFGHPADVRKEQSEDKLKWEQVHIGKF